MESYTKKSRIMPNRKLKKVQRFRQDAIQRQLQPLIVPHAGVTSNLRKKGTDGGGGNQLKGQGEKQQESAMLF